MSSGQVFRIVSRLKPACHKRNGSSICSINPEFTTDSDLYRGGKLQPSQTIVSASMGFFTHSANQSPDERYLEVILGMPDIVEGQVDFSIAVIRFERTRQDVEKDVTRPK